MKLLELQIENFGVFSNQPLSFGDGGFQLVYGENEAGKSTLLQLIRELLFGFPHVNQFAFDDHVGEMAATARVMLADETTCSFRRRKGRRNTVIGEFEHNGRKIDEPALAALLGSATMELYQHVFAFSLAELSIGEKSLAHANLNEALYGGGMGGLANFQRVQRQLQEEQESLFAPRGTTRAINRLLKDIKESKKRLRETAVKPQDYTALVKRQAELAAGAEQLRAQLEDLRRRRARQQRLIDALPKWRQVSAAEAEKAALKVPLGFPHNGADEFRRARETSNAINEDIASLTNDIDEKSAELAAIEVRTEIIDCEPEIKALSRDVGKVSGFRNDLPDRINESRMIKEQINAQLHQLQPGWNLSHLDKFQTSLAQRTAVADLNQQFEDWEIAQSGLVSQRKASAEELAHLQEQRDVLGERGDCSDAVYIAENAKEFHSQRRQLDELNQEIAEASDEIDMIAQRLNAPLETQIDDLKAVQPPLKAGIGKFQTRFDEAERKVEQAQAKRAEADEKLHAACDELARLEAQRPVPTRDQLIELRRRRDAGWSLVRRRYVEKNPAKDVKAEIEAWLDDADANLPDAFEKAVEQVDLLADERQTLAELAASRDRLAIEIEQSRQRIERASQSCEEAASQRQAVWDEWRVVTEKCSLTPLKPAELAEWRSDHEQLLAAMKQRAQWRQKADELAANVAAFKQCLQQLFPENGLGADGAIEKARQLVEKAQQAEATRNHLDTQIPRLQRKLKSLDEQIDDRQRAKGDLKHRWEQLLTELELPQHYDVRLASTLLNELAAARLQHEKALSIDRRIADMQTGTEEFHERVANVCKSAAPELTELPAEDAVLELDRRLEKTKQDQARQVRLESDLAAVKKRLESRKEQLQTHAKKIKHLLNAAEAADEVEFWQTAEAAARRHELDQEIAGLARELHILRENEDEQSFSAALAEAEPEVLAEQLRTLESEIVDCDRQYKQAVEDAAIAREELARFDGESQAAQVAMELESQRSELNSAAERWAALVLAQKLMKDAILDFEQKHQPAMLQDVERLFGELTLGRYTHIRRKLDEQGTLQVQERGGGLKEPHQLSTGTREQLYLAIRLAYILHYCKSAEPLPIVMDDVLVNFDDGRARQTFRVLLDIAKNVQIIFMTCHETMVELAKAEQPECEVLQLSMAGASAAPTAAVRRAR